MIETERLILRKFTIADLDKLIELRSDDEVIQYIGGRKMQTPEAIESRLKFYIDCYDKHGFGMCAMIWKETGEMIGWSGLQPSAEVGNAVVGYGMIKDFWRKGIGYECARSWVKYGFEEAGVKKIIAVSVPENAGSRRIIKKCGMSYEKTERNDEMEWISYSITKDEYLAENK